MTVPTVPQASAGQPFYPPPAPTTAPAKFNGLAWSSLILGIVGVVFSAVPILDIFTMLAAIVGIVLGGIALFGSRKILAASGTVLCVLAVVFTALVMNGFTAAVGKAVSPAPPTASVPAPVAPAAPVAPPAPAGPATSFGEGTYAVGTDIAPGTYHTSGPSGDNMMGCYWERSKDTSGSSIITNGLGKGPATITISSSDGGFTTSGCNTWAKVG